MGASLTQPCRVPDDGLLGCKRLLTGKKKPLRGTPTVPVEEAPANSVPAAAVIRRGLALFGITGRKAHVGGFVS